MIAQYYGRYYSTEQLRAMVRQTSEGTTLLDISEAAEQIGMHTIGARLNYNRLMDDIPLPGIIHWRGNHFVVVIAANEKNALIADPDSDGISTVSKSYFLEKWTGQSGVPDAEGIILLLEPTVDFFTPVHRPNPRNSPRFIWKQFAGYGKLMSLMLSALLVSTLLAAIFPLLLQTMIDESVEHQNPDLLSTILLAWLSLFTCQLGLEFVRRLLLFHLGSKVNISLLTSFMIQLLSLPLSFFQSRRTEDVMQTLYDNTRIQRFFSHEAVSILQTSLVFVLYSLILLAFNWKAFLLLLGFSILQVAVIFYFLKRRKDKNFIRHDLAAARYSQINDLIRGIKDIKLTHAEKNQRWAWERSEAQLYQIGKSYSLSDEFSIQLPFYLGELRNILIVFVAAKAVTAGEMTIGVLAAIVFIFSQLNNPLRQLIEFLLGWQETKLHLERMDEVRRQAAGDEGVKLNQLPEDGEIIGEAVSFRYEGGNSPWVYKNLNFRIPKRKTTAIIGPNGSGKSTLLNLVLNFLHPQEGLIKFGGVKLDDLDHAAWLAKCGVVPQDGHLFHASIARNIALGHEQIDHQRLLETVKMVNLLGFLERQPLGVNAVVGEGGAGLSKGQRQCILIARAIYHQPGMLFLDEATNDLDPESEKIVLERIAAAFKNKTLVILSSRPNLPIAVDHVISLAPTALRKNRPGDLSDLRGGEKTSLPGAVDEKISITD
jgi:ATP-binding cassette subfamily B protein